MLQKELLLVLINRCSVDLERFSVWFAVFIQAVYDVVVFVFVTVRPIFTSITGYTTGYSFYVVFSITTMICVC